MRADNKMTLAAVGLGILLGALTDRLAENKMWGALYVIAISAVVSPIAVCLVARGWWMVVGVIPILVAEVISLASEYSHAHRFDGATLSSFLHNVIVSEGAGWWVFLPGISFLISLAIHGFRRRAASGATRRALY